MKFYHGVPEDLEDTKLLPLTELHKIRPDLYAQYAEKYKDRPEIMARKVPLLDCLWNDVVQLLPLHPQKVFELQVKLGLIPEVPPYRFFEIDSEQLELDRAVVFFKTAAGEENTEFKWLRDIDVEDLKQIPQATKEYYQSLVGSGELPFNYQFIPHILYKGKIDISDAEIIELI